MTLEEAHQAVDMMLGDNKLGDAGARVVIEEFLVGEEAKLYRDGGRKKYSSSCD
jgi:phosphoribosylamine-glycine ligase